MVRQNKNISGIVRLLTVLAIISVIAIVSLTGLGMNSIYSGQVLNMAREESILISRLLVDHNFDTLISRNEAGRLELRVDPLEVSWLNKNFSDFLMPLDILKIKIYSPRSEIIYSSENDLIGEVDSGNERLMRALAGEVDSQVESREQTRDLNHEIHLNIDLVETYVPIRALTGEILGAVELYMDVTKFREEISAGTRKSLFLLTSVLLSVYISAYAVARIGLKRAAEAETRLHQQATVDPLTGVLNRGELMSRAETEFSRLKRSEPGSAEENCSLAMLDIDHFKRVNDDYGHQCGDAVLQQVARQIREQLRPYDILGRYGGEEFLIVLSGADLTRAAAVAERIRGTIAAQPFTCKERTFPVTVSIGVSLIVPGSTLAQAVDKTDRVLYLAKQNGRNRVEVHAS
jgi:diguanylate cyclase (GGDEF)-like protein